MLTTKRTISGDELESFVTPDGVHRLLAAFPSMKPMAPRITEVHPTIPKSSWEEFDRRRNKVPILDQAQHGQCVGYASAKAVMCSRVKLGMNFELLSGSFIYSLINGGRDAGSDPADAANVLVKYGTCLMSERGVDDIFNPPESAFKTAQRFKVPEDGIYSCQTIEEVATAIMLDFDLFTTIRVGNNFNDLDKYGVPPVTRGMGNHCIYTGARMKRLPSGLWLFGCDNSWTNRWGDQGYFCMSEEHYEYQPMWQAIALKYVAEDPQNPLPVPKSAP